MALLRFRLRLGWWYYYAINGITAGAMLLATTLGNGGIYPFTGTYLNNYCLLYGEIDKIFHLMLNKDYLNRLFFQEKCGF